MHFAVILTDRKDGLPIRLANRPAHIEWLKSSGIPIAGPFLDETGEGMIGTLLIVEADDEAGVVAIIDNDPYAKADLFESRQIRPWRWVVGKPA
ncbi:YciI family protein [Kaistia dalseonensis]|uniref:Uncharacterized protein YciI n=1 Tax=Kaistia dalseonensis TaxID=410840 RepID=A0ABU0H749_9HYPH|nr:YciI family protein [Kaistia dalseonensis]MCX5494710.1 YciI family protein [Kaistia dalseonensis]MDQ0437291.1 uncharacterized protein YciI [Kaistia dalseonensis]